MNDIEDRLLADAVRVRQDDQPAPPLESLLDVAIGQRPTRRRLYAVIAVAAVLVLAAGLAVAIVLRRTHDSSPPAGGSPLPTPHRIVKNGEVFHVRESSPIGVTRDPSDAKVLRVEALDRYELSMPECSHSSPTVVLLDQTATTVTIETFDYSVAPIDHAGGCLYGGQRREAVVRNFTVLLDAPLGSRRVIDVRTGKQLALLEHDDQAPKPSYLPRNYQAVGPRVLRSLTRLGPDRTYVNDSASLDVEVMEQAVWAPQGQIVGRVAIDGSAAVVSESDSSRCMSWSNVPGLEIQICSSSPLRPLPTSELLRVANSLPR